MAGLSKTHISYHRQCPKRLWLHVNRPELAEGADAVTPARFSVGRRVNEIARSLVPRAILIDSDDSKQALADTARALSGKRRPILEAAFRARGLLIRADVLRPARSGHRLEVVKSSTKVKDHHLEDVAIQAWVIGQAGLRLTRTEIACIDKTFVYPGGGDYAGLFQNADVSREVRALERHVPTWMRAARRTLAGSEPKTEPGAQCQEPYTCPYLDYCRPPPAENQYPPEFLSTRGKLAPQLRAEGFEDLRQVPRSRLSKPRHRRIWRATKTGRVQLAPEARERLGQLRYPRYYLDFETANFAVPVWAGTRPYQQVPFQWSCHVERRGGKLVHYSFLADGAEDPRRPFAESLIATLKSRGPIFVYSHFERDRMDELATEFPDLAGRLWAAIERLVDLLAIAREHYYHRDMRGSWSLKHVLPTIAPELTYDGLEIADGGMAQAAFAEMLDDETPAERRTTLREALLQYCERDTQALVRVARYFEGRSGRA